MRTSSRRLILVIGLGIFVFAGISVYGDVQDVRSRLATYQWWTFFAALGLALVNYALRLVRWGYYLRHEKLKVERTTGILVFLSGFALSVTPGKLGELIKSYLLRETHEIPISKTIPIVIAERVTDLGALLMLGAVGFFLHDIAGPTVLAGTVALGVGLVVVSWPRAARFIIDMITAPGPVRRFRQRLREFYENLASLLTPGPLARASILGILAWLAECIGFALIIGGFAGTDPAIGLAILIYAVTTIAGALSFLPGGLLVTEAAMTILLVQTSQGLDEPTAVAATILTRLATLWFAVFIGGIALIVLRRRAPRVSV